MIERELAVFLIVGVLAVAIDFASYHCLIFSAAVSTDVAKSGSFLMGTVFAYFANRFLTFGHNVTRSGSPWRFGFLYLITLGVNVIVNAIVLKLLVDDRAAVHVAFLAATSVSASLNFLGLKLFVFRHADASESP